MLKVQGIRCSLTVLKHQSAPPLPPTTNKKQSITQITILIHISRIINAGSHGDSLIPQEDVPSNDIGSFLNSAPNLHL